MARRNAQERAIYRAMQNLTWNFNVATAANGTIRLEVNCPSSRIIQSLSIKTASGTITAALQKNGVNITNLSAIAVTSVLSTTVPTDDGTGYLVAGDTLDLVLTANAAALGLSATVAFLENG